MPFFTEALAVYAPVSPVVPTAPTINPSTITTGQELLDTMQNVLGWAFAFALVLGIAALIAAGILYITAGGAGKAKTATNIIIYAVAGIAITGFSWALVNVLGGILFGKTFIQPGGLCIIPPTGIQYLCPGGTNAGKCYSSLTACQSACVDRSIPGVVTRIPCIPY